MTAYMSFSAKGVPVDANLDTCASRPGNFESSLAYPAVAGASGSLMFPEFNSVCTR